MDDFLQELDSLFKESERSKNARLDEKKKKSEEDRKKALKVWQKSLETFSQTRKRRNKKEKPAVTRCKKNNVLTYLFEKNEWQSRLKEKELELK